MDKVFSDDDIFHLWSRPQLTIGDKHSSSSTSFSAAKFMYGSDSDWPLQRFLQEESSLPVSKNKGSNDNPLINTITAPSSADGPPNVPMDSEEYHSYLKSRLNLACDFVALSRENEGGLLGTPALQKKSATVEEITISSGSSRDRSDVNEVDGETGKTTQNMDPAHARRNRRRISNRESARRSRRRHRAQQIEIETKVAQLRVEFASLHKCLSDIHQRINKEAVDHRVLKAERETIIAKQRLPEGAVKRNGLNPFIQTMAGTSTMGMPPSFAGSDSDIFGDDVIPVQDGKNIFNKMSDEHLQKPFR